MVCVIAAGIGIFQSQRPSGVPATSVPNTPPLTSAAPSPEPDAPRVGRSLGDSSGGLARPVPHKRRGGGQSEACGGSGVSLAASSFSFSARSYDARGIGAQAKRRFPRRRGFSYYGRQSRLGLVHDGFAGKKRKAASPTKGRNTTCGSPTLRGRQVSVDGR